MTERMRSPQLRTLLAGLVIVASAAALSIVGETLGVTDTWPVLLVAGTGLLVGVPRLRHALALLSGVLGGAVTVWIGAAVLPVAPVGRATATAAGVLLLTVVTLASRGRLRLSVQLVGWAAAVALLEPAAARVAVGGASLLSTIAAGVAALLVAAGLGLLVAQVTQLVATGTLHRRSDGAAGLAGIGAAGAAGLAVALLAAPTAASADVADVRGVVEHRQTIVRSHAADGTVTGGSVVTRLSTSGAGEVTVVLRDQAVRGLRSLTGLAGAGPLGERAAPDVVGRIVTHRLTDPTTVRTVAVLDRELPVQLEVAVTLDGEPVTPAAVVGRSGRLRVTYTLINTTAELREVRHFDGAGRPRTVTRDVAVPLIGDLVVTFDDRFRAIRSEDGLVADGSLRTELVLAAPAGAPVRTVTWSADVDDAALPPVRIQVTPVALTDTARGDVESARLRASTNALRDIADAGGLTRTGVTALLQLSGTSPSPSDDELAVRTLAILDGLLAGAAATGAELDELRALIALQDARARDGDGEIHPLIVLDDVDAAGAAMNGAGGAPRVEASVLYVLEVAGRGEESVPGTVIRLLFALGLLAAVGLLGRAIGRVTAADEA